MSDIEARQLLGAEVAPVLEIENPVGAFCGFVDPAENASFEKVSFANTIPDTPCSSRLPVIKSPRGLAMLVAEFLCPIFPRLSHR